MGLIAKILLIVLVITEFLSVPLNFLFLFSNDITVYINDVGQYNSGMFMGCVYGSLAHCDDLDVYMKHATFTKSLKDNYSPSVYLRNVEEMIVAVSDLGEIIEKLESDEDVDGKLEKKVLDFVKKRIHSKTEGTAFDYEGREEDLDSVIKDAEEKLKDAFSSAENFKKAMKNMYSTMKKLFSKERNLTPLTYTFPAFSLGNLTFGPMYSFSDGSNMVYAAKVLCALAIIFSSLAVVAFILRLFTDKFKILNYMAGLSVLCSLLSVILIGYYQLVDRGDPEFSSKVHAGIGMYFGVAAVVLGVISTGGFILAEFIG